MNRETPAEIATIVSLVETAAISDECKHSIQWCLQHLAPLYHRFSETYDNRITEEIRRLESGILWKLMQEPKTSTAAKTLSQSISDQLKPLHERLGLKGLEPKAKKTKKAA